MFAAGFAALNGARVLLLEKNQRCGAKVLITGKGRCNVTNSETDPLRFVEHFGRQGKALLTALYAFGVEQTVDFFEQRGLKLRTERGGRVFPARGGAADVQKQLAIDLFNEKDPQKRASNARPLHEAVRKMLNIYPSFRSRMLSENILFFLQYLCSTISLQLSY